MAGERLDGSLHDQTDGKGGLELPEGVNGDLYDQQYLYLTAELGRDDEAARPIALNWARNAEQSMDEVRAGILWERENRLNSSPIGLGWPDGEAGTSGLALETGEE